MSLLFFVQEKQLPSHSGTAVVLFAYSYPPDEGASMISSLSNRTRI